MAWCVFCRAEVAGNPGDICPTCGYRLEGPPQQVLAYRAPQMPPPPVLIPLPPPRRYSPIEWGAGIVVGVFLAAVVLVFVVPFVIAVVGAMLNHK
jgi:hypothetical protein